MERASIDEYYLIIARDVATRSTCLRRRFGAVIVRAGTIVSTGYVGAPRGSINCIDVGFCMRRKLNIPPGTRYELCESVHAETNAIINAARAGVSVLDASMYLYGENVENGTPVKHISPCKMCARVIINAGIKKVIVKGENGEIVERDVDFLLRTSRADSNQGYK